MGALKKTTEEYISELVDWDETTREEAASALGEIGDETVIEPLITALKEDESEDVRAASARSLGKYDSNLVAKELGNQISNEESPIVRIAIASAISEIGDFEAIKLLKPILKDEESHWVREAIIEAFGKLENDDYNRILIECLKSDPSEDVRIQAANSLMRNSSKKILDEILLVFKKEESDEVKSHITELIAEIPDIKSVELLTDALENNELKLTQAAAAEALHKIAIKLGYKDENEMIDSL